MALVKSSPSDELQELVENINAALNSIGTNSQHIMGWVHTIKTKELWRQTEAKTFSQFCEMQDWTPRRFNQLAAGYETLLTIPKETGTMVPTERHLRELAKAPEKARERVVKETEKRDGKVTAKGIKKTIESKDEYQPTEPAGLSEPVIVRDETGVPIPPKPLEYWNRRQEVKDMMNAISKLKCQIEKAMAEGDPIWINVSQHIVSQMEICYSYIKDAMPHSLCTVCNGWPEQTKCDYCNGMGILSKRRYMGTDDRIRSIREKAHAQFLTA